LLPPQLRKGQNDGAPGLVDNRYYDQTDVKSENAPKAVPAADSVDEAAADTYSRLGAAD